LTIGAWNEITISCVLQAWDKLVYQEDKSDEENKTENNNRNKSKNGNGT
jgi:hypothetical protein